MFQEGICNGMSSKMDNLPQNDQISLFCYSQMVKEGILKLELVA